jgi:hypothetical protein
VREGNVNGASSSSAARSVESSRRPGCVGTIPVTNFFLLALGDKIRLKERKNIVYRGLFSANRELVRWEIERLEGDLYGNLLVGLTHIDLIFADEERAGAVQQPI